MSEFNKKKAFVLTRQFCKMAERVGADQLAETQLALIEMWDGWLLTIDTGKLQMGAVGAYSADEGKKQTLENLEYIDVRHQFTTPALEGSEDDKLNQLFNAIMAELSNPKVMKQVNDERMTKTERYLDLLDDAGDENESWEREL